MGPRQDPALLDLSQGKHLHPVGRVGGRLEEEKSGKDFSVLCESCPFTLSESFCGWFGSLPQS